MNTLPSNESPLGLLHVESTSILNPAGEVIQLRGTCLGGWMNMENFITGFPGCESDQREAVASVLGKEKAAFFFERFLDYFITESDIRFLAELGATVIRVPFNYRHFEDDYTPFSYHEAGFQRVHRVVEWARIHKLYVILDFHALPGFQNRGWHCDNPGRETFFWGQKLFEDRVIALWEEFARRYKGDAVIAGYNLVNEPDVDQMKWLNQFYRRAVTAIRAIDPDHIIFLEGNRYSREFDSLDVPFAPNLVYSSHNYTEPCLNDVEYPGVIGAEGLYDLERLMEDYSRSSHWMRQHQVPIWVGEFGSIYSGTDRDAMRIHATSEMIDIFTYFQDHWTTWTYKDLGRMGLVTVAPDAEYMRRTEPIRRAKSALRCDSWIERAPSLIDQPIVELAEQTRYVQSPPLDSTKLQASLLVYLGDTAYSKALLPAFAEQFRDMTEMEIDTMMQGFLFDHCVIRTPLAECLRSGFGRDP